MTEEFKLNDFSYNLGGSMSLPIAKTPCSYVLSADYNIIPVDNSIYKGVTISGIANISPPSL